MQTPVTDGGAREFVQNGYLANGEFYFAYRNFEALEAELTTPRILICPTDTRSAAANFVSLRNHNLSYFVGVDAEYFHPETILSGDRNLVTGQAGSSIYPAAGQELRWSGIMHRYKGNLLFADGHVEEAHNFRLAIEGTGNGPTNDFFIPVAKADGISPGSAAPATESPNIPGATNPANSVSNNATNTAEAARRLPVVFLRQNADRHASPTARAPKLAGQTQTDGEVTVRTAPNAAVAPEDEVTSLSFSDYRRKIFFRSLKRPGCLLLLLLVLLWLLFRLWQRWRQRQKR